MYFIIKNNMNKIRYILINFFISVWVLFSVFIAYAAWNDTATTGSSLTASIWNDMATAVWNIEITANNNSTALNNHLWFQENKQIFTSWGTFTVPAGITKVFIRVQAWWGGGKSWSATTNNGWWWWAWGYCEELVTWLTPWATVSVTVWAWGVWGTSPTAWGVSFFGSHCSAGWWAQWVTWRGGHGWIWSNGDFNLRWWNWEHPMVVGTYWDGWWSWWNSVFFGNGAGGQWSSATTPAIANSGAWWWGWTSGWSGATWSNGWSGVVIVYW